MAWPVVMATGLIVYRHEIGQFIRGPLTGLINRSTSVGVGGVQEPARTTDAGLRSVGSVSTVQFWRELCHERHATCDARPVFGRAQNGRFAAPGSLSMSL